MADLLTLSQVRAQLWKKGLPDTGGPSSYQQASAEEIETWNGRLNQVVERLMSQMNPARCYRKVDVPIYNSQFTLPREVRAALQVTLLNEDDTPCSPLFIYSRFHQFAQCCGECGPCHPVQPISENAQTFRDPSGTFKLRLVATEENGSYTLLGGKDADGNEYFDSVTLAIENGTTTTVREWSTLPRMLKPLTNTGVNVYSVDSDGTATLIAVHAPSETNPAYQRYSCPTTEEGWSARVLTRLCFNQMLADTDIVIPSNLGVLSLGLQALRYEDVSDDRAEPWWSKALALLDSDKQMLEGSEAQIPVVRGMPGFGCGNMASNGWGPGIYGYGYAGNYYGL